MLHAAGRAYPASYKRIDWWDTREGPLPNPDVQYPELEQPAAFACTNRICSQPVFDPVSHLVNVAERNDVTDVWVRGRRMVADRALIGIDAPSILARTRLWQHKLGT